MSDLPPLDFNFVGLPIRGTWSPARPQVDVKASALLQFGSDHRAMVGRSVLMNDQAMIVDSASDLGNGYWRLRLTEDRWAD